MKNSRASIRSVSGRTRTPGVTYLFAARANRSEHQKANKAAGSASSRPATLRGLRAEMKWQLGENRSAAVLYTALIQRLLDTKDLSPRQRIYESPATWQRKTGLPTNGVLDEFFYPMVSEWQGGVFKGFELRGSWSVNHWRRCRLYDPRGPTNKAVRKADLPCYKRCCAALDEIIRSARAGKREFGRSEKYLKIISSTALVSTRKKCVAKRLTGRPPRRQ